MGAEPVTDPADPNVLTRLHEEHTADMTRLRDSAERWRNGIAMLTGLISAVLVFKGPDPVAGLSMTSRILLYIVVILAVALGMAGCFCAIRAAAGLPVITQRPTTIEKTVSENRDRRIRVARLQRWAIGFSAVMVLLLLVSTGLAWFLPRAQTSPRIARLQLDGGRVLCGQMLRVDDTEVAISVFGQSVTVPRGQVVTLSETQDCG
jgi:hypothetical protein